MAAPVVAAPVVAAYNYGAVQAPVAAAFNYGAVPAINNYNYQGYYPAQPFANYANFAYNAAPALAY